MSFFNPEIPVQVKDNPKHPWANTIKDKHRAKYKFCHNSVKNPMYPDDFTLNPAKKIKMKKDEERIKFIVIGNRIKREFIYCLYMVKGLYKYRQKHFEPPVIRGVTSIEWPKTLNDLKLELGGLAYCLKSQVAVLMNGKLIGGETELKEFVDSRYNYQIQLDFYNEGVLQFANFIKSSGRPCAYMHISINGEAIGTLIFMLYADLVPRTCQNFLQHCEDKRGGYSGTPIHRIVKDCWIQCGGFGLKNNTKLDCENFIVPHDRRGVLGMANDGRHVDCSTQFYVLLQPASWMAHKYVAFGQLIEGESTLSKIESVQTWYEAPTAEIKIDRAGVFNMECHYRPINKKTNEYISGHIEELNAMAETFCEKLLDRVFAVILEKLLAEEAVAEEEKGITPNIHATERFIRKKEDSMPQRLQQDVKENPPGKADKIESKSKIQTGKTSKSISKGASSVKSGIRGGNSVISGYSENNEFDVDEYEYEFEGTELTYKVGSVYSSAPPKPERLYYIPLTDIPYPGEVSSMFCLKKLLQGDYCLASDIEQGPRGIIKFDTFFRKFSIPCEVLNTLFEDFNFEDEEDLFDPSEHSLDLETENEIKTYLSENADSVSFAGPVITKMADLPKKFKIFDYDEHVHLKAHKFNDEHLRLIRLAAKEVEAIRDKKVSLSLPMETKLSHTKIKRRATGFVWAEDIEKLEAFRRSMTNVSENDVENLEKIQRIQEHRHLEDRPPRISLLSTLFEGFDLESDDDEPTLKGYKAYIEEHTAKKFHFLSNSPTTWIDDDEHDKRFHRSSLTEENRDIDRILCLQHGKKISRKVSSDYVKTIIDQTEHKETNSLRSIEYAKKRPLITVSEYRLKNQKYKDELKAKKIQSELDRKDHTGKP